MIIIMSCFLFKQMNEQIDTYIYIYIHTYLWIFVGLGGSTGHHVACDRCDRYGMRNGMNPGLVRLKEATGWSVRVIPTFPSTSKMVPSLHFGKIPCFGAQIPKERHFQMTPFSTGPSNHECYPLPPNLVPGRGCLEEEADALPQMRCWRKGRFVSTKRGGTFPTHETFSVGWMI